MKNNKKKIKLGFYNLKLHFTHFTFLFIFFPVEWKARCTEKNERKKNYCGWWWWLWLWWKKNIRPIDLFIIIIHYIFYTHFMIFLIEVVGVASVCNWPNFGMFECITKLWREQEQIQYHVMQKGFQLSIRKQNSK